MSSPRVVLFDWGETLVRIPGMFFDAAGHLACARVAFREVLEPELDGTGVALDEEAFIEVYERAAREQIRRSRETLREHGFADRLELTLRLAGLGTPIDAPLAASFADRLGEEVLRGLRLAHDEVPGVVRRLHSRFRLGVVSNYPHAPVVARSLELLGLDDAFEAIVVSGAVGWTKPHPEVFAAALDAMSARPEETVFVGDDIFADMQGAKAAGMRTAWYAPGRAAERPPEADVHLESLEALLEWLAADPA